MAMTLRLSEGQTAKLRATAEPEGISMNAAALKDIDDYASRRDQLRNQIISPDGRSVDSAVTSVHRPVFA